jgi:hypothetical protein
MLDYMPSWKEREKEREWEKETISICCTVEFLYFKVQED